MVKDNTILTVIQGGACPIHTRVYNKTGLSGILSTAGVPKGSRYFYFKNKKDFDLAGNVNRLTKDRSAGTPLHRYIRCRVESI